MASDAEGLNPPSGSSSENQSSAEGQSQLPLAFDSQKSPEDPKPDSTATTEPLSLEPVSAEPALEHPQPTSSTTPQETVESYAQHSDPYHPYDEYHHSGYHAEHAGIDPGAASSQHSGLVPISSDSGNGGNPTDTGSGSPSDDEEGGPVKGFLDHLEDLRWTLVWSVSTILLCMLACMVGGNFLVKVLTRPIREAMRDSPNRSIATLQFGSNILVKAPIKDIALIHPTFTNVNSSFTNKTATNLILRIVPVPIPGTNNLYTLQLRSEIISHDPIPDSVGLILKNYSPIEGFMVALKLALFGGLILAAPIVIYFIGKFVFPALKIREKKFAMRAILIGSGLFLTGVAFCYFLLMPVAIKMTVQFSTWLGFGADEWRAGDYLSFITLFMLGIGLSFELPVVLLTLVKIGILDHHKLSRFRSYWFITSLVIGAVITPSADPFTMMFVAAPLVVLYEISHWIAWYWDWRDRRIASKK